jgi:hypothetical protein
MGGVLGALTGAGNQGLAAAPVVQTQANLQPNINTAQQGVQSNIGNQNAFAQALQTQMNGGGPNLAATQLANATGQNVANQAALMASQRGSGSNAGLIARQAAQQGGALQQNAAGQAAQLRAQQQLAAQGQLAGTYGQIGTEQGQNLATNQQALASQNQATNQATLGTNQINAQIGANNAANQGDILGGIGAGLTAAGATGVLGTAGKVLGAAEGGEVPSPSESTRDYTPGGISQDASFSSELPLHLKPLADIYHPQVSQTPAKNNSPTQSSPPTQNMAKGGKVQALVSPGERFLKPEDVKDVAKGKKNPMEAGVKIPGKPVVPGAKDDYANDTVPKKLETGGIVIPRHITQGKNPGKDASDFVMAIINKKGKKK